MGSKDYDYTVSKVRHACTVALSRTEGKQNQDTLNKALKKLRNLYLEYLEEIKESTNFPDCNRDKQGKQDERFLMYLALIGLIPENNFSIPDGFHKKGFIFKEGQYGWPVKQDDPFFNSWLTFIRGAVKIFKASNPEVQLDAWIGEPQEVVHRAPVTIIDRTPMRGGRVQWTDLVPKSILKSRQSSNSRTSIREPDLKHPPETVQEWRVVSEFAFDDWDYSVKLQPLVNSLQDMHAYGRKLNQEGAADKGKLAMLLAKDLFRQVEHYFKLNESDRAKEKIAFIENFRETLHSQDNIMSAHRSYWKVIIANIAAALTVVGLLAISVNLFRTGQLLFSTTRSEQKIAASEAEFMTYCELTNLRN